MSQVPQIAPLPPAPRRSDAPEDFSAKADALASAQPGFVSQANAQAEFTNSRAESAASSASAALSHANKSKEWAEAALEVEPGQFSSKHYALKSSESAASSAESAALAESKAAEAAASAASADLSSSSALSSSLNAAASASEAAASAALVEAAMQDIAGGPVASVAGLTGVVSKSQLGTAGFMTDETLPTATPAEMQAGTVADVRAMSPSLVAQAIGALAGSKLVRSARTSNVQLTAADNGKFIDITSGTFTQTFAACSTLGNGWWCYIRNSGAGDITLDPNASEQVDGLTSYVMYPGEVRLLQCDGTTLRSVVLNSFYKKFTVSGTFTKPPGYVGFEVEVIGGGAGGRSGMAGRIAKTSSTFNGAAGGAAGVRRAAHSINSNLLPQNVPVVVGAGGTGGVGNNVAGGAGGESYFNTLTTLSSSSSDIPRISSLVSSGSAGGAGGSASWTSGGWNATGHPGGSGAYIGSGVPVPSGGAGSTPTGVYLQGTTGTFTYTGQPGGSTSVPFCSGAGGGSAAISYSSDNLTGTINVTGGDGGDGGLGAGGGGGGHALCSDEGNYFYTSPTLNIVSGKGGNGGSGLVQVWGII